MHKTKPTDARAVAVFVRDQQASRVEAEHYDLRCRGVDIDDVLRWARVPSMFAFGDLDQNTPCVIEHVRVEEDQ